MSRKVFSGRHKSVMCEDVRDYLENEKLNKPSIYMHELQARLLLDGVCFPHDIPSKTSVNRFLNEELRMSQKRIMQVPSESLTGANIDSQNEFLDEVSRIEPCTLHFFDKASVIRTSGNRRFGQAYIGEPAIEYQRYASNANYTVNLLHSVMGVDHYSILDGPSIGTEMLLFFDDDAKIARKFFLAVMRPRLKRLNPIKYLKHQDLDKDLMYLQRTLENKIPPESKDWRLPHLIESSRGLFSPVSMSPVQPAAYSTPLANRSAPEQVSFQVYAGSLGVVQVSPTPSFITEAGTAMDIACKTGA